MKLEINVQTKKKQKCWLEINTNKNFEKIWLNVPSKLEQTLKLGTSKHN